MKDMSKKRTLLIVGGLWLAFLLLNSFLSTAAVKTIPYSEFLRLADEGKVSAVAVSDKIIQGRMFTDTTSSEKGEPFQTVRVDSDLSGVLDQNGIEYTGKIQ